MKTQILKLYVLMMLLIFATATTKAANNTSETSGESTSETTVNKLINANTYTVKIFDSKGNMVFQENDSQISNNESQFLGNLAAGYYTYQVIQGDEMVYRAIISTSDDSGSSIDRLPGKASASIASKDEMVLVRLLTESDNRARIVIRDENNQIVYSKRSAKACCQHITYDFSNLPQGKYYVNVLSKGVLVAQKRIVK